FAVKVSDREPPQLRNGRDNLTDKAVHVRPIGRVVPQHRSVVVNLARSEITGLILLLEEGTVGNRVSGGIVSQPGNPDSEMRCGIELFRSKSLPPNRREAPDSPNRSAREEYGWPVDLCQVP